MCKFVLLDHLVKIRTIFAMSSSYNTERFCLSCLYFALTKSSLMAQESAQVDVVFLVANLPHGTVCFASIIQHSGDKTTSGWVALRPVRDSGAKMHTHVSCCSLSHGQLLDYHDPFDF